jgi:hypothetical protein
VRAALLSVIVLLAGCQSTPTGDNRVCTLPAPTVLEQSGDPHGSDGRLLQVWDVPDDPVLWSDASPSGAYADFVAQVEQRKLETDPLTLLRRSPTPNNLLVVSRADDWIRPAGCLEKLMTGYQHARIGVFDAPTEFASVVMRSPDGARLRIYYYTINQDGIGRASPFLDPADVDAARGWTMELVLHPHVFHPGQPELDGLVGPSVPDADLAYNLLESGLKQSWITNGIHTVRIPAEAFGLFTRE